MLVTFETERDKMRKRVKAAGKEKVGRAGRDGVLSIVLEGGGGGGEESRGGRRQR